MLSNNMRVMRNERKLIKNEPKEITFTVKCARWYSSKLKLGGVWIRKKGVRYGY